MYMDVLLQDEFEKVVNQFSSRIYNLYLNETKVLKQEVKQQNAEIKRLELQCTDYAKTIQQLEETNEALKEQLQERETLLKSLNKSAGDFESEVSFEESDDSYEEETSNYKEFGSLSYSYSTSPAPQTFKKRSYSEPKNQVVS